MQINGFMHVATMGNWRDVVDEQFALIKSSGLSDASEMIYVGLAGDGELTLPKGFSLLCQSPRLDIFEYETLSHIWKHSHNNDGLAWYIHTKGVSKTAEEWDRNKQLYRDILRIESLEMLQKHEQEWRRYMQHFVLKSHRRCVEALQECDVVGASWRETPCPHFSGNFWWARTSYLRGLCEPHELSSTANVFGDGRGGAEFWLGSGSPRAKSLCDLAHNFYRWGVKKQSYMPNRI